MSSKLQNIFLQLYIPNTRRQIKIDLLFYLQLVNTTRKLFKVHFNVSAISPFQEYQEELQQRKLARKFIHPIRVLLIVPLNVIWSHLIFTCWIDTTTTKRYQHQVVRKYVYKKKIINFPFFIYLKLTGRSVFWRLLDLNLHHHRTLTLTNEQKKKQYYIL